MSSARASIGELSEQIRGVSYDKDEAQSLPLAGYSPILRAGNITDDGLSFEDLVYVPDRRISAGQKIRLHDVVIAASSGSLDVVGKAAQVGQDYEGSFGAFCKVLRPNSKVHPRYFGHFFKTREYRRRISALAAGININNLRSEHLDELEIPLPSIDEQRRIAEILDKADELRAKRRAALAQIDALTQSVFLDVFGDPTDKNWPMTTVASIADPDGDSIRTGPFGSQLLHSEFVGSGICVLGIDNVVTNEFQWGERRYISGTKYRELKRYTVKPGDVLITIMGTCGRCAVVPEDIPLAINTKHLCCITLDRTKCLPHFLHAYFLRHPIARRYLEQSAKGAIMSGLNMGIIKGMPISVPPIELQKDFSKRLAAIKVLRISCCNSETEMNSLFDSLQYRAFRGEL